VVIGTDYIGSWKKTSKLCNILRNVLFNTE